MHDSRSLYYDPCHSLSTHPQILVQTALSPTSGTLYSLHFPPHPIQLTSFSSMNSFCMRFCKCQLKVRVPPQEKGYLYHHFHCLCAPCNVVIHAYVYYFLVCFVIRPWFATYEVLYPVDFSLFFLLLISLISALTFINIFSFCWIWIECTLTSFWSEILDYLFENFLHFLNRNLLVYIIFSYKQLLTPKSHKFWYIFMLF